MSEQPAAESSHFELLNGHIVKEPPADWRHGSIGAALVELLRAQVRTNRLGLILDSSTGIELPSGDTVEPDVTYISHAHLAADPVANVSGFLRHVPTLVIEILSPSTARRDRVEKKAIYEHNAIPEYWIVDPEHLVVMGFHLVAGLYDRGTTFTSGNLQSAVLPGLAITIDDIFEI